MKIQILGTGCPNCQRTAQNVEAAMQKTGQTLEVEKITQMPDIVAMGAMALPAIAIDGQIRLSGHVPSVDELTTLLQSL